MIVVLLATTACGSVAYRGPASSTRTISSVPIGIGQSPEPSSPSSGEIAGNVSYPAGSLHAQTVYAIAIDGSRFYTLETVFGQSAYTLLGVPSGDYFVFTTPWDLPGDRFQAGYTRAISCGLTVNCNDHSLISVHVAAGVTTSGIGPVDWYAPRDFYPLIPSGVPPARSGVPPYSSLGAPPPTFQDAQQAAVYFAQASTRARSVQSSTACPFNIACVWITGKHDGQAAAYFTAQAGSNGSTQNCAIYLISTSSGWHVLGGYYSLVCSLAGTPFPTVGGSGQIQVALGETGCVNVHSAPSLSAKVVACLPAGTAIALDDGPAYVPASNPLPQADLPWALDYWWHIAGRGWVVHLYVLTRHYG